jgi:glycosyltransferase involved in cell wall biosynthesis
VKKRAPVNRILLVTSSEWAGPYIRDLVFGFSNQGIEVIYFSLGGPLEKALPSSDRVTDLSSGFSADDSIVVKILKTYKVIKKSNPDLLFTHFFLAGVVGTIAGKLSRTKVILTRHHIDENHISGKRILFWLDQMSTYLASHIVVCSQAAKKWMIEVEKCDESKITVINQGFFFEETEYSKMELEQIRLELGFRADSFNLICICRYTAGKGHKLLIEAFKEILTQIPNLKLAFIGHGDPTWLREIIRAEDLEEHVRVLPQRTDVFGCIESADVVVHPSLVDSFSQLIIEAQFIGRPIVAFDIAAAKEQILEGRTGFVVTAKDTHAMAEKILILFRNPELRITLGENGIKHVKSKFTHKRMMSELNYLLDGSF